ncbi:MAG: diacylglycerol kinase family protein [Acidimicrobiales bacterium]|nr:diacylglycerol kinase family protein [Acidimicrobiales bacterium]
MSLIRGEATDGRHSWGLAMGDDVSMAEATNRDSGKVALLANPAAHSGTATRDLDKVLAVLHERDTGVDLLAAGSAAESIRAVAGSTAERVLVMGGDGTVHLAASVLAGTDRILGILPCGTGDDAARALGLLDGDLALRVDRALSEPVSINLITGAERPVVTSLIAGFPVAVNSRANAMRFPRGASRYTIATLLEIPRMVPTTYRLTLDGAAVDLTAAVVVIANTAWFGGGMEICPGAEPTDGLMDICVVGDVSRIELLQSFRMVDTGAHVNHPGVSMFRAAEVSLELLEDPRGTGAAGDLRADGEAMEPIPPGGRTTVRADKASLLVAGAST